MNSIITEIVNSNPGDFSISNIIILILSSLNTFLSIAKYVINNKKAQDQITKIEEVVRSVGSIVVPKVNPVKSIPPELKASEVEIEIPEKKKE